jgi:hypothetical protein
MEHRTAANPVDRHAVNEIGFSIRLSGAYGSREEAQGIRLDSREAKPSDIDPDAARLVHWQECYGQLWELKVSFEKQHNR